MTDINDKPLKKIPAPITVVGSDITPPPPPPQDPDPQPEEIEVDSDNLPMPVVFGEDDDPISDSQDLSNLQSNNQNGLTMNNILPPTNNNLSNDSQPSTSGNNTEEDNPIPSIPDLSGIQTDNQIQNPLSENQPESTEIYDDLPPIQGLENNQNLAPLNFSQESKDQINDQIPAEINSLLNPVSQEIPSNNLHNQTANFNSIPQADQFNNTFSTPIPNPQTTNNKPDAPKNGKLFVMIGLLFMGTALSIGGFFAYNKFFNKKEATPQVAYQEPVQPTPAPQVVTPTPSPTLQATPSASPKTSTTKSTTKPDTTDTQTYYVIIKETSTGWLNARSEPSTKDESNIVAKLKPDEIYRFIESNSIGWFKIELENKDEAWIASQYATKITQSEKDELNSTSDSVE